jgi:hypothetical protein
MEVVLNILFYFILLYFIVFYFILFIYLFIENEGKRQTTQYLSQGVAKGMIQNK